MKKYRRLIAIILLIAFYVFLIGRLFSSADSIAALYPAFSLRFSESISQQAAADARESSQNNQESAFWPTFWNQDTADIKAGQGQSKSDCIYFNGNAELVLPVRFLSGGYPGATDLSGCALSSALAWKLWGSLDVVGKTTTINGHTYTVRGIFSQDEDLILAGADATVNPKGWKNAELEVSDVSDIFAVSREAAETYAVSNGLGQPQSILNGPFMGQLANTIAQLPLLILLLFFLPPFIRLIRRLPPLLRSIGWLASGLLLISFLPSLLSIIPSWLIPGKWSDTSHWQTVMDIIRDRLREWFALIPLQKDIAAKEAILIASLLLVLTCIIPQLIRRIVFAPLVTIVPASPVTPADWSSLEIQTFDDTEVEDTDIEEEADGRRA